MDLNNEQNTPHSQLSLFDYQLPRADFSEIPSGSATKALRESDKASRFLGFSTLIHCAALLAAIFVSAPAPDFKTEPITIEIADDGASGSALGEDVEPTLGGHPQVSPAPVAVVKPLSKVSTQHPVAAVSPTLDDIEAPDLESDALSTLPVETTQSNLEEDLDSDLSKIDQAQQEFLQQEESQLAAITEQVLEDQDRDLESLKKAAEEEQARLHEKQQALRKKNAAAVAAAQKSEGVVANSGPGKGNDGASKMSSALSGTPQGVRSLDQLQQKPGNPRPKYERTERLRGDQGEVIFVAYISKEGFPSRFKLMKSTGFKNLDAKTLAALKKWRFQPGQEGWVEMPFRWDLKGDVQQDGGLLRKSAQRY